jgi:hypothetical protein
MVNAVRWTQPGDVNVGPSLLRNPDYVIFEVMRVESDHMDIQARKQFLQSAGIVGFRHDFQTRHAARHLFLCGFQKLLR